jgi:alpha-mannosidase
MAPGHFEYEWTAQGDLCFTLLRSVGELSRDDLRTRPGHAGWPTPVPGAQCLGHTRVELALAPVPEAALAGSRVHEIWEDAFLPPACHWIRSAEPLEPSRTCAELDGDGLVLSAVKPPEVDEGLILRCCNATDEERDGTWWVTPPPVAAWRARADERMPIPIPVDARTGAVRFRAGPREIVTVRVS